MKRNRLNGAVAIVAVLALVAAACSSTAGEETTTSTGASGGDSTDAALQLCEGKQLDFWYQTSGPEGLARFEALSRMFEEKHDDLTIEITPITFDDMKIQMPLALDSGGGPDIAYVSPLDQGSGLYASGGHLLELTDIVAERNWTDRFPAAIWDYNNVANPGQYFGLPYSDLIVGLFYNTEKFDELGLEVPETFDEFEQLLADIKGAGETPIEVGGLDGWPLAHVFEQVLHLTTPIEHIAELEKLNPDFRYDAESVVEAATYVQRWNEAGYLGEFPLANSYSDANTLFINGDAVMNLGGTWAAPEFQAADFETRFFPMPPMDPDRVWNAGGHAVSDDFIIPIYGTEQDCAIEFLDFILSEEAMTFLWTEGELVAYRFDTLPPAADQLQEDLYNAMQTTGPGYYMGVVNAEVNDANWEAIQGIVAGDLEPQEALESVQVVYEEQIALLDE